MAIVADLEAEADRLDARPTVLRGCVVVTDGRDRRGGWKKVRDRPAGESADGAS
jgi:hypothetical protein